MIKTIMAPELPAQGQYQFGGGINGEVRTGGGPAGGGKRGVPPTGGGGKSIFEAASSSSGILLGDIRTRSRLPIKEFPQIQCQVGKDAEGEGLHPAKELRNSIATGNQQIPLHGFVHRMNDEIFSNTEPLIE